MSEEVSTFDWDSLNKELENKGMKFSAMVAEISNTIKSFL